MPLEVRIELPAPSRPVGGLLSASRPLPAGWERGVTFADDWCLGPASWPYCPPEESPPAGKEAQVLDEAPTFQPLGMYQAVECTTMDVGDARELARETLEATGDWLLGVELATGATTGNPSLNDGTPVAPGATGVVAALATVEGTIADNLFGRLGFIHVAPSDLTLLVAAQALVRDGRVWRSPGGHVVVSSAGYESFAGELHATGEVFAAVSAIDTRADVDRAINQTVGYAEQIGLAVFPPCFNISVEVT